MVDLFQRSLSGVFEIYSDVTPFLQQIDAGSARVTDVTTRSQARVEQAAIKNQREAAAASSKLLLVVGGLLALVYAALLVFVRNGQRIIDQEARAREQSALGEQRWHRDKMAAMAAMAANISHEVGNPLAIISGLAEDIERWHSASEFNPEPPRMILEQTLRIANMTRRITEFATARSETSEPLDINQLIEDVCAFLGFDGRFRDTPIELRLSDHLSACVGIPDHLTEVLMGLLQAHEEVCKKRQAAGARILVQTQARGKELMVGIWCECSTTRETCSLSSGDSRLESARRRMDAMGGRIELADARLDIYLRSFTSNASGT